MFLPNNRQLAAGITMLCLLLLAQASKAQVSIPPQAPLSTITTIEYFFNTDPGMGNGVQLSIPAGVDVVATASANTSALGSGVHRLYTRARDAAGQWGLTNLALLYVAPSFSFRTNVPPDVTGIEYFFDVDPGQGNALPLPVNAGQDIAVNGGVNVSGLSSGIHYFNVRAKDGSGNWGLTNVIPVYKIPAFTIPSHPIAASIIKAEYFVDADPGFGNGVMMPVTPGNDITIAGVAANISGLSAGVHSFYVRTMDANGNWSLSNLTKFSLIVANINIPQALPTQAIAMLEYFFDTDPGLGNGTLINVPATTDLQGFTFAANVSGLGSGTHVLYARTVGRWSITSSQSFTIGAPLPVKLISFNAFKAQGAVQLNWTTAMELDNAGFTVERSKDAKVFEAIGYVEAGSIAAASQTYAFKDEHPLPGVSYYRLKQTDNSGQSNYSHIVAIRFGELGEKQFTINNPVQESLKIFHVKTPVTPVTYLIADMQGRQMLSCTRAGAGVDVIDVRQLPAGSYTVQARGIPGARPAQFVKD